MKPFALPILLPALWALNAWATSAAAVEIPGNEAILKVRGGTLRVEAPPGSAVRVEQLRHEFWFGATLPNQLFGNRANSPDAAKYREVFLANFNAAVTENALKWHVMEANRGQIDYSIVNAMLEWTAKHELPLRGHNVFWGTNDRVPAWQKDMDNATLRETLRLRAVDVAKRYRGKFAEYDLNNEMVHGNYYEKRLGPDITLQMAQWMRHEDPAAVLFLNDYDILTGRKLDAYVEQIRTLLAQGVPLGGIGVQGHSHGEDFDPAAVTRALNRLAEFRLPIRVTEFNFPGQNSKFYQRRGLKPTPEEEKVHARKFADYYRVCVAHPGVHGIMLWGFWEGANWIPSSSLYRRDWSITPNGEAYRDLVFKQWWTDVRGQTDAQGRYQVQGLRGKYRVTVGGDARIVTLGKDPVVVKFP